MSVCGFSILDPNDKMISFEEVNRLAYEKLSRSKCTSSDKKCFKSRYDESEKNEDDEDAEQRGEDEQSTGKDVVDEYDESMVIDELYLDTLPDVSSITFHGIRIFDSIDNCQSESFFIVEINGNKKYMHKQTANWYFSKTKPFFFWSNT